MPRLPLSLIHTASHLSPYLRYLLRATRDLTLARHELTWLHQYTLKIAHLHTSNPKRYKRLPAPPSLAALCRLRSTGWPLQYILGSQPFCELEVLCGRGVLVPRAETETYTTRLANLLLLRHERSRRSLRVLDLCAGTGCIGLGILSLLHTRVPGLRVRAVDINRRARSLALKTVRLNSRLTRLPKLPLLENSGGFEYRIADILDVGNVDAFAGAEEVFDVVVANPPYISVPALARDTSRSARCFEPRDALVPPLQSTGGVGLRGEETGDVFYSHILRIARRQQAKIVVMEVADSEQAWRVIGIVQEIERMEEEGFRWDVKEIWCDEIDVLGMDRSSGTGQGEGGIGVLGSGHGRAVVLAYGWGRHVL